MKYLVTGGGGFVGSNIVNFLLEQGHQVVSIDYKKDIKYNNSKARYVEADISSFEDIEESFKEVDAVFHTAALAGTVLCIEDPLLCYKVNVLGSVAVLEASRKHGVKRVVLSSSIVVYGAETPYKYSKLAMEEIASVYSSLYKVSNICLRYANVYGKGQDENRKNPNMFAAFKKSLKEKGYIQITGDGEQTRDMIHVSDIVDANIAALNSEYNGVIDICTGRMSSLNYIVKELLKAPLKYSDGRPGDVKETVQNLDDALNKLGWKAKVSIEDGVKELLPEFYS
jgi:UDP-glucose 4-epimerase